MESSIYQAIWYANQLEVPNAIVRLDFSWGQICTGVGLAALGAYIGYRMYMGSAIFPYSSSESKLTTLINRPLLRYTRTKYNLNYFVEPRKVEARVSDNGHKVSGQVRDAARRTIDDVINAYGWDRYEISPTGHSSTNEGIITHFATDDLHDNPFLPEVGPNHLIVAIDTDYYVEDWSAFLGTGRPALIFTFAPNAVSGNDGDCHFRIKDNVVYYEVSGGNIWIHKVWNWTAFGEHVCAMENPRFMTWFRYLLSFLGIRRYTWSKIVFSRPWDDTPHRALVWSIPKYSAYQCTFFESPIHARMLERINYKSAERPGWNKLVYVGDDLSNRVSIGREGDDAQSELKKKEFDVLMGLSSQQSVTTRMLALGGYTTTDLALMGQYYSGSPKSSGEELRLARGTEVMVHWPMSSTMDIPEVSFRSISTSLVPDSNAVPAIKRWESLSKSIDQRVTFQVNTNHPPAIFQRWAQEFLSILIPESNVGVPYSWDSTIEKLDKPSQVLAAKRVLETLDAKPRELIEGFIKNEPTHKASRIISSFPDARYLIALSRYTLAMRDEVLHSEENKHWFMPGKDPVEIANSVCEYVASVIEPAEGDYSNFDGTVSAWLQRNVINAAYLRWTHHSFRDELLPLLEMLITCPARAKRFGFRYEAGPGIKSGSPTTCDGNSVLNGFLMYAAIRRECPDLTPQGAYAYIGLAFGDDSLFDAQFKKAWNWVVNKVGMKLKVERYDEELGITFLARVFPDPLKTTSSFQDPLRTLRKLHLTSRNPTVPLADAAVDRCSGYLVTDKMTPVVSAYCHAMLRRYGPDASSLSKRLARADNNMDKPYWVFGDKSWPQKPEDVECIAKVMANRMGISVEVLLEFHNLLVKLEVDGDVPCIDIGSFKPVADSLERDGLPSSEPVDQRELKQDVELNSARIPKATADNDQRDRGVDGQSNPRLQAHRGSNSRLGGSADDVSKGSGNYRKRNRRASSEAKLGTSAQGRDPRSTLRPGGTPSKTGNSWKGKSGLKSRQ
nr:MAG: hypothetical protein [Nansha Islands sediment noda-like virus 2]